MGGKVKRLSLDEFSSISTKHLKLLQHHGIESILAVANMHPVELKDILDTTINKARSIIAQARASLPDFQVETLRDVIEKEENQEYLPSGVPAIDHLLGGYGFQRGSIYELAAEFGAGKSQLAMTMAVSTAARGGGVAVIDTEGAWRGKRLVQICKYHGYDQQKLIENLRILRPISANTQSTILRSLIEDQGVKMPKYLKMDQPLQLLVVDSLTGLFRAEFPGRAVLAQRQHLLAEHLKNLYILGKKHNITVILTNQVIHSPDIFNPGVKAVGGNIVGHACTYRMIIKKKRGLIRILQMVDSATLPIAEAPFKLGLGGVMAIDAQDNQ